MQQKDLQWQLLFKLVTTSLLSTRLGVRRDSGPNSNSSQLTDADGWVAQKENFTTARTRTVNLLLRRQAPCPLGHSGCDHQILIWHYESVTSQNPSHWFFFKVPATHYSLRGNLLASIWLNHYHPDAYVQVTQKVAHVLFSSQCCEIQDFVENMNSVRDSKETNNCRWTKTLSKRAAQVQEPDIHKIAAVGSLVALHRKASARWQEANLERTCLRFAHPRTACTSDRSISASSSSILCHPLQYFASGILNPPFATFRTRARRTKPRLVARECVCGVRYPEICTKLDADTVQHKHVYMNFKRQLVLNHIHGHRRWVKRVLCPLKMCQENLVTAMTGVFLVSERARFSMKLLVMGILLLSLCRRRQRKMGHTWTKVLPKWKSRQRQRPLHRRGLVVDGAWALNPASSKYQLEALASKSGICAQC